MTGGKVDRLPILVSVMEGSKLLAVPPLPSSTGAVMVEAMYNTSEDWDLVAKVGGICFDTTSSNPTQGKITARVCCWSSVWGASCCTSLAEIILWRSFLELSSLFASDRLLDQRRPSSRRSGSSGRGSTRGSTPTASLSLSRNMR